MNQNRLLEKLEGFRKRNSTNPNFVNKDIYHLLYDETIYIIAYNAIKSNHGAETKGADGTSLNGFCMEWVYEIISSLRNESYRPLPNKTQLIPKKTGKCENLASQMVGINFFKKRSELSSNAFMNQHSRITHMDSAQTEARKLQWPK